MKPADPETRTFFLPSVLTIIPSLRWFDGFDALGGVPYLLNGQCAPEGEHPPTQVPRDPLLELEVTLAFGPIQPDRRQFSDGETQTTCFGGEFQTDLESVPRVDS